MKKSHNFFIYFIQNRLNGKIYVGKTVSPKTRWGAHKNISKQGKEKCPGKFFAIHASIKKYGADNFVFDIIENHSTNEEANEAEIFWISYLTNLGVSLYNETKGGDGATPGVKFTEEHKKNISISKTGVKASVETRLNMSRARKFEFAGEKNNKAKITEKIVKEIRYLYGLGNYTYAQLGIIYGLSRANVGKIIRYELWAHVK
jgi:group I intron endonuclease